MNAGPSLVAIKRTIAALEAAGLSVRGARLLVDGSVELLTGEPVEPPPAALGGSWVDLAGEAEAGRA